MKKTESRMPPGDCLSNWLNQMVPVPGMGKMWKMDPDQLEGSCNNSTEWKIPVISHTVCPACGRIVYTDPFRWVYTTSCR